MSRTRLNSKDANVLILRALPWGADSRSLRWATIYAPRNIRWGCWGSHAAEHRNENILHRRPSNGYSGFVLGYFAFIVMCFFYSLKHLRRGDTLLCIDLETALLGLFAAKLRGARVHYDMADPFYLTKPVPFKPIWRWLERQYIRMADLATAPHASRFDLFFDSPLHHTHVVENVPDIRGVKTNRHFRTKCEGGHMLILGYFGTLAPHRGIEDLIAFVQHHPQTRMEIGGLGPLQKMIEKASQLCSRIHFVGPYKPEDLVSLTREVDVYCSLYYSSKPLHRWAAPNKYFEHLALKIPILISACTPNAIDVHQNNTGWVIPDGRQALDNWYLKIHNDVTTFDQFARCAGALWSAKYADWQNKQKKYFSKL